MSALDLAVRNMKPGVFPPTYTDDDVWVDASAELAALRTHDAEAMEMLRKADAELTRIHESYGGAGAVYVQSSVIFAIRALLQRTTSKVEPSPEDLIRLEQERG